MVWQNRVMNKCHKCGSKGSQQKVGKTASGSQRYKRTASCKKYTPCAQTAGYDESVRQQAVRRYLEGMGFRRIGRLSGVHPTSVMNWVNDRAEATPAAPVSEAVETVEMDELYTFIGEKKFASTSSPLSTEPLRHRLAGRLSAHRYRSARDLDRLCAGYALLQRPL